MNIFPAIDLKENKCVRLIKGKDSTSVVFNENPVEQAKYFEDQGCKRLHLVDLDSAFGRNNINNKTVQNIKNAILKFQSAAPSNLPDDKMEILDDHFDAALATFALVDKLQKVEVEYNDYAVDYIELHFTVRKKQKKIIKLNKKIDKYKAEIRNLDDDELDDKNKIELKIEDVKLEIDEIKNSNPDTWNARNSEFDKINKAKNTTTKRYRRNVDDAYDLLD